MGQSLRAACALDSRDKERRLLRRVATKGRETNVKAL
jgi:hypothetical protein